MNIFIVNLYINLIGYSIQKRQEEIARIRRQISERLKDLGKTNPNINTASSNVNTIGGSFSIPSNPMGGNVRPPINLSNNSAAIQAAREKVLSRINSLSRFVSINIYIILKSNY